MVRILSELLRLKLESLGSCQISRLVDYRQFVISPDFHKHYNREAWVCFFHCEASMNGEEVQTVVTGEVEDTPTKVDTEEKDVPAAPSKPKHNKNEDEK